MPTTQTEPLFSVADIGVFSCAKCGKPMRLSCIEPAECVSAWNKDPVFGVIGIQSGPRH